MNTETDHSTIASRAIAQSAAGNGIISRPYSREVAEELLLASDDHVTNDLGHKVVHEYWGTDDDGDAWRVHLIVERQDW